MNREIRFRGKNNNLDAWYEGSLYQDEMASYIQWQGSSDGVDYSREVDPETVGQYTGLKDKNGIEIYEGDIVKIPLTEMAEKRWGKSESFTVNFGKYVTDNESNEDILGWMLESKWSAKAFDPQTISSYVVIGNIYDNPELLETL